MIKFYLIRHGETDWNEKNVFMGQNDIPLNILGEKQSEVLISYFKNIKIDHIYSSDLSRAIKTAEPLAKDHGLEVITDKRLTALGENETDYYERVSYFIHFLLKKHNNEKLAIVTHGRFLKAWLFSILTNDFQFNLSNEFKFKFYNGSVSLLQYNDKWEISYLNDSNHLINLKANYIKQKTSELLIKAKQAFQKNEILEAENLSREILVLYPDNANALNFLGIACFQQRKYEEAVLNFKKLLLIKPDYTDANYNLANILKEMGNLNDAIIYALKAVEAHPEIADNYNVLGSILRLQGKFHESAENYKKAISIEPGNYNYFYNLGLLFKEHGYIPDAKECFHKAIKFNPGHIQSYYNLANIHLELNETELAESYFKKILEINPNFTKAHERLALIQKQQ